MVNKIQNNRQRILELLAGARGDTLSGVSISEQTGISRVAVWKHIKALKTEGLPIASRPRGYALESGADLLLPFCFRNGLRERIFHFHEVDTTMNTARALARKGAPHMSCCIAEHQTQSRGRLNRKWVADKGGLWFTLILKPDTPPPMAYVYNFASGLCLSRVIQRTLNLEARVKWPNDLLLEGRKLVGILSEMETRSDMISYLLIGIGVNVNNNPSGEGLDAVSLKNALGRPVSRQALLTAFLDDFSGLTQTLDRPGAVQDLMARWKTRSSTIGTSVRVETLDKTVTGIARDVDDTGTLIVETEAGRLTPVIYGDCFHT